MPGKATVGVVFDLRREDEGVFESSRTTVFGLKRPTEVATLLEQGLKITDKNPVSEGIEIETSGFHLMRLLGELFGFAPMGGPIKTDLGDLGGRHRSVLTYTLVRDAEK